MSRFSEKHCSYILSKMSISHFLILQLTVSRIRVPSGFSFRGFIPDHAAWLWLKIYIAHGTYHMVKDRSVKPSLSSSSVFRLSCSSLYFLCSSSFRCSASVSISRLSSSEFVSLLNISGHIAFGNWIDEFLHAQNAIPPPTTIKLQSDEVRQFPISLNFWNT